MKRVLNGLGFLGGLASLLLGLLTFVKAPIYHLWLVAVAATEWGHWLLFPALLSALPALGRSKSRAARAGAGMGVLGALLLMTPLLRAQPIAHRLPKEVERAFGPPALDETTQAQLNLYALARPSPLVLGDLYPGIDLPPVSITPHVFTERDGQQLVLDLYSAQVDQTGAARQPQPLIVQIHGGSWSGGDRTQLAHINRYLAGRGYLVASVSYRFAPTHIYPAALEDVRAALDYLVENADALNIDPTRIALMGRSAGGQLALLTAYTEQTHPIRAVIAFYAPTDLRMGYLNPANPLVMDSQAVLSTYLGGSLDARGAIFDEASPINYVNPDTPATLLIHGTRDELVMVQHSRKLAERLAQHGVPHLFIELPWATHGCEANLSGPCGQISIYAIEQLLLRAFAPGDS